MNVYVGITDGHGDSSSVIELLEEAENAASQGDLPAAVLCYRLLRREPLVARLPELEANILGNLGMLRLTQGEQASAAEGALEILDETVDLLGRARTLQRKTSTPRLYDAALARAYRARHRHSRSGGDLLAANLLEA